MKQFTIITMIMAFVFGAVTSEAADKKDKGVKAEKAQATEITLTGTIEKVEKKVGEKTKVSYVLTTEDGAKVTLPKPRAAKGEQAADAINLDDYVDANVKFVGKGTESNADKGKKIAIRSVISIERLDGPGVEEPAADADKADDFEF